jgi:hypothetical protein
MPPPLPPQPSLPPPLPPAPATATANTTAATTHLTIATATPTATHPMEDALQKMKIMCVGNNESSAKQNYVGREQQINSI